MFTGYSHQVREFDSFVNRNYSKLLTTSQQICWNHGEFQDVLQNNLIKVRERITKSGWTSTTYSTDGYDRSMYSFLWRSMSNEYKTLTKREGKRRMISTEDEGIETLLYEYLEDQNHDSQLYRDNLELFVRYLFEFLEIKYDQKKSTLFKSYFLTGANTYKKLAKSSGLNERYIQEVIREIKRDVKENLFQYISVQEAKR